MVARADDGLAVCAAIEPYGSIGLLRSIVVAVELRGTGLGRELVAAAESLAVSRRIHELYLLTETAAAWFPRLDYETTTQASAPAALAASPEFTGPCPDSAAIFRKRL